MSFYQFCFLSLFALFGLLACEKVIDVPLNEAAQTVVVEAVLKDGLGNNYVRISKTGTVYSEGDFETIADAVITITDSEGNVFLFPHVEDGYYSLPTFEVIPGRGYDLEVLTFDRTITASCQAKSKPSIDSLTYIPLSGVFGVPASDTVYLVSFHSVDNVAERNFYWVKIFRNGNENSGFYLGNDDFINGQYYEAQFFGSEADPGDSVLVEMISCDEANYNYLIGLSNNINSSPFSAAPANPPSNLVGDAVGFFGVYTTDTLSILIP